jgi:hypothetical protein
VAALLKEARPDLAPADIEERLKATGKWVQDDRNGVWTPRVDARVALLTDDSADFDGDGCSNAHEYSREPGSEMLGGRRNPLDPFDFYDLNGDRTVNVFDDIIYVADGFGPVGPNDPRDRGPTVGPYDWNSGPPDGYINVFDDVFSALFQFGHSCG